MPIQIGENFSLPEGMEVALDAGASDWVMPDLERIGGVTGFMRAAALAQARRIEMSSHLFPEVSAHLLAATPTAHWLEYVDWMDKLVQEPLRIVDGCAVVSDKPGNGLVWDAKAVETYRVAHLDLDLHFQQRGAQRFAVRIDGERCGHTAAERILADELQRTQLRQLVARHLALDDAGKCRFTASGVTRSRSSGKSSAR